MGEHKCTVTEPGPSVSQSSAGSRKGNEACVLGVPGEGMPWELRLQRQPEGRFQRTLKAIQECWRLFVYDSVMLET